MKVKLIPFIFLLLIANALSAATISGYVSRAGSGEPLQYVNMQIVENQSGMQTNKKGYYVINIPEPGSYTLKANLISYESFSQRIQIQHKEEDIFLNITLSESYVELGTIRVSATAEEEVREIRPSYIHTSTEDIKSVVSPIEADVFRAILALPGVAPISDFSSGLYVRGGSPDQNLILLDDIDVYNPSHFGGVFSTFNTDAVENIDLIKGAYPAKYGGRLSSVLDVTNRQGNRDHHEGIARWSLISSSGTLEGPWHIGKIRGSYMASLRRTYLELIKTVYDELPDYYFYDGHAKINWDFSSRDKLSTSAYFGRDRLRFDFGSMLKIDWGNRTFSTEWVHIFNPRLFSQFVIAASDYTSNFDQVSDEDVLLMRRMNGIEDITNKAMLSYCPNNRHELDFGWEMKFNRTWLKMESTGYQIEESSLPDVDVWAHTGSLYFQDNWDLDELWTLQPGFRLLWHNSLKANLKHLRKANYLSPDPRISIRRKLDISESVYAAYGLYHQYLTLLAADISTPFDMWFPIDASIRPGNSQHFLVGYKNQFNQDFALDFELYYKDYQNLLELKPSTNYEWDNDTGELQDVFYVGSGFSYGADILLRTNWQGLEGFVGLTLSKTKRKLPEANLNPYTGEGEAYYPAYDRSVALNIIQNFNLSQYLGQRILGSEMKIGLNFALNSGQPAQKPERIYFDGDDFDIIYSYKDRDRLPAYCRLDISTKYQWFTRWGYIEPYIEVINLLNRKNVGFRNYSVEMNDAGSLSLKQRDSSQFPILPFFGVNVKW